MKNNLEKEFVTYEQALALHELGFDEMCFGFYSSPILELMHCKNSEPWMGNGVVSAPLKQQVFRWFREKYGLYSIIHCPLRNRANFTITGFDIERGTYSDTLLISYEEAENACIDKLISICKQQKNER